MYNRFENGIHPREPLGDLLAATTEHTQSLSDQADYLTKVMHKDKYIKPDKCTKMQRFSNHAFIITPGRSNFFFFSHYEASSELLHLQPLYAQFD